MNIIKNKSGTITNSRLLLINQRKNTTIVLMLNPPSVGHQQNTSRKPVKDGTNLSLRILTIFSLLEFGLRGIIKALAA